jgi:hypothetical protein
LEDRNRDGSKITLRYILEKKNSKVGSVEKWLGIVSIDISGVEPSGSDTWLLIKSFAYDCFSDGLINGMTDKFADP